jgi:hypothetical protein
MHTIYWGNPMVLINGWQICLIQASKQLAMVLISSPVEDYGMHPATDTSIQNLNRVREEIGWYSLESFFCTEKQGYRMSG